VLSKEESQKTWNLTDPDAPIMKGKKGVFDTNYNVQVGCSEDQIITYSNVVTDGNDKAQLIPALEGIRANTGQTIKIALADADFGTLDSLEYMHLHNICGYVPYRNMNATFEDQPFHSVHFRYDPQRDVYLCPAQQALEFKGTKKNGNTNLEYRQYRTDACKTCPFHNQCCSPKAIRRTIRREVRQYLREEMKERLNTDQGKQMYLRRLHPIEAIFGHFKYNLGYTRFLLRGLEKVKAEFTLMCLAYNLRKLAPHILFSLFGLLSALSRRLSSKIFCRTRVVKELELNTW
jgi:hypothetical protein